LRGNASPAGRRAASPRRRNANVAAKAANESRKGSDIVQILRERISLQQIPPGSKLLENELSKEFGVSRTTVREALCDLELRGLIKREPNRGAVVSRLDLAQVFEIYDAREALEGMCVRLATLNTPPESWQDMVELFGKNGAMEKYLNAGDLETFFAHYEKLRKRIIEAAGNRVIAAMLDSIHEKTRIIMRRVQILPERAKKGLLEHRAFLAAMRKGDAEGAERLRRENIRSAIRDLERYQSFVL
jgi:DNA-binding GntR family transcriptional regulator